MRESSIYLHPQPHQRILAGPAGSVVLPEDHVQYLHRTLTILGSPVLPQRAPTMFQCLMSSSTCLHGITCTKSLRSSGKQEVPRGPDLGAVPGIQHRAGIAEATEEGGSCATCPISTKQVCAFLELASYYCRFVPNITTLTYCHQIS